jgi:predicted Zn-dependent protease with MMP-like domain/cytochrome c-type biogenesis protein CcmH/NrfG
MTQGSQGGDGLEEALARIDAALVAEDAPRALAEAQAALARWPGEPELYHAKGVALRADEKPEEALDALREALTRDPALTDASLDAAEVLVEDMTDPVSALEVLAQARRHAQEPAHLVEIEFLRGVALAQLEDFTGALAALDAAARNDAAHADVQAERGSVLIELLRLDPAEAALRESLRLAEENARAHELLAFLLDYTGRREEAADHFGRAAALDPELPSQPPRLVQAEFDAAVDLALAALPAPFRERLANVEVAVEDYASKDFCRRHDCSPTVLGIYVGTPLTERQPSQPQALPDRIVLFQRSLENSCRDRDELVEEIAVTLKHEVGHLLGFSEEELHERGYE